MSRNSDARPSKTAALSRHALGLPKHHSTAYFLSDGPRLRLFGGPAEEADGNDDWKTFTRTFQQQTGSALGGVLTDGQRTLELRFNKSGRTARFYTFEMTDELSSPKSNVVRIPWQTLWETVKPRPGNVDSTVVVAAEAGQAAGDKDTRWVLPVAVHGILHEALHGSVGSPGLLTDTSPAGLVPNRSPRGPSILQGLRGLRGPFGSRDAKASGGGHGGLSSQPPVFGRAVQWFSGAAAAFALAAALAGVALHADADRRLDGGRARLVLGVVALALVGSLLVAAATFLRWRKLPPDLKRRSWRLLVHGMISAAAAAAWLAALLMLLPAAGEAAEIHPMLWILMYGAGGAALLQALLVVVETWRSRAGPF